MKRTTGVHFACCAVVARGYETFIPIVRSHLCRVSTITVDLKPPALTLTSKLALFFMADLCDGMRDLSLTQACHLLQYLHHV